MRTARLVASTVLVLLIGTASAGAAPPEIRLLGPDGNPAVGAEVLFLDSANVHLTESSRSLVLQRSRSDAKGRVRGEAGFDHICFLAFSGENAVFVCHHPFGAFPADSLTATLSEAVRIRGRLDLPADTTAEGARVRAIVSGGYEGHGIDAEVDESGAFELPPLPVLLLRQGEPVLEARVPGLAPRTVRLGPESRDLVLPIRPWRYLTGRIVGPDGAPVDGARLACVPDHPVDRISVLLPDEQGTTSIDGRFRVPANPGEGFTLYVFSDDHAASHIPVAAGVEPLDLGDLALESGRTIRGRVREEDGRKVLYAFVSLTDARGVRIGSATVHDGEPVEIPHVGPAHADVLIAALRRPGSHHYLLWALDDVVGEPQRELVLSHLAEYRELAEIVLKRGWAGAARDTLVAGLEQVLEHHLGSAYVPTEWIAALASLRDPATYDLLKRYLARGMNPHMTWREIHDLPGIDVSKEVAIAWDRAKTQREDDLRMFAPTAARCGHLDALARLVASLSFPENDRRRPYHALETILEVTVYDGPATAKDLQDWFDANREKLVYDRTARRFVVRD